MGQVPGMIYQNVRVMPEVTPGTFIPPTKLLQSMQLTFKPNPEIKEFAPAGAKLSSLAILNREWATWQAEGAPTYDELTYALAGMFNTAVSTPGGGTAKLWTALMKNRARDTVKTFSADMGEGDSWERVSNMYWQALGIEISREDVKMTGSGIATRLDVDQYNSGSSTRYTLVITATGGTFTLTHNAQTTGALAFNVSLSALQTALEGLSTIGAGNVAVSGSVGSYVINLINDKADAAFTVTGSFVSLTSGSGTLTQVQPGAALTTIPLIPILPQHFNLFLEDSYGALGVTPQDLNFNVKFEISDKGDAYWPIKRSLPSYGGVMEKKPSVKTTLTVAADAAGKALYGKMRAGATKFMRVDAQGDLIEAGHPYQFTIDTALKFTNMSDKSDSGGVYCYVFEGSSVFDASIGGAAYGLQVLLKNTLAAL